MRPKLTSIVLMLALVSVKFSGGWTYLAYLLNKKYIADNLCANRTRPEMQCEGKCVLMQKLKKAEENEKKHQESSVKSLDLSFVLYPPGESFSAPQSRLINQPRIFSRSSQLPSTYMAAIFRPPQDML